MQHEPEEQLEIGGEKFPGQDRALSCLLLLSRFSDCKYMPPRLVSHRSDTRDRVLSSEPQEQGMRLGELVLRCPRRQTEVLCRCRHGVGLGFDKRAVSPAQTAPSEGFIMDRARQSNRELYMYKELQVEPLSQGVRAVGKHKDVSMLLVEVERRQIHARKSGVVIVIYCYFLKRSFRSRWNLMR